MKKTGLFLIAVMCAWGLSGCTANTTPASNTNANTNSNANAAKPVAAAPTSDALMVMDKAANEAWSKGDPKWFQDNLSSKFVMYEGGQRMDKDAVVKMIGSNKCDVKSMNYTEPAMTKINDDLYVLTYKGSIDGNCTMNGKTEKLPAESRAVSAYLREGDKWMGIYHGENPIVDPTKAPPPPAKKDEKAGDHKDMKKEANASNSAANSTANTAAPAAPAKSANTDALTQMHNKGWEAFKNKDAKWFEANLVDNSVFVDPFGNVHTGRTAVVKLWTETMKCEGITKTSFSDSAATSISPTVELLTGKGTADGKCDGQPNGDLYQTSLYVKEGNDWKLAFMVESLPMPGM